MKANKTRFYCTACGNELAKWAGKCPACGAWNTIEEVPAAPTVADGGRAATVAGGVPRSQPKRLRELDAGAELRFSTGLGEFDRVLGGGAVRGSLVLVGGSPGIGHAAAAVVCPTAEGGDRPLYYRRGEPAAAEASGPTAPGGNRRALCPG